MAKDWITKIVRDEEQRRKKEAEEKKLELKCEREVGVRWSAFVASTSAEIEQDVKDFNGAMSRRSGWKPLAFKRDDTSVSVEAEGPPALWVLVSFNPENHRITVKMSDPSHFGEPRDKESSFVVRPGSAGGLDVLPWESNLESNQEEYVTNLSEFALRPLVERLAKR